MNIANTAYNSICVKNNTPLYLPRWVWQQSIFFALLTIVIVIITPSFSGRMMTFSLYSFFVVELLLFFYYGQYLSHSYAHCSSSLFIRRILLIAFILRIPLCLYFHFYYLNLYGETYYDVLQDVTYYVGVAVDAADKFYYDGSIDFISKWVNVYKVEYDDLGCPFVNTMILILTGNISTYFVLYLSNCILGTCTIFFIYKTSQRHFGESIAKLTAVFCTLNPNMIWWCGSLMKETQMVFFTCWFINSVDKVLIERNISFSSLLPGILIGFFLMLYRSALGIILFISFFISVLFISRNIVSTQKNIFLGLFVALSILLSTGNHVMKQFEKMVDNVESGGQQKNMEWRTRRLHGNEFAKYAGAAVFAPLIFTIPFPTLTYTHQAQEPLMQVAGGNYIKNVLSFFVILSMFVFLLNKTWRQHVFIISFTVGYLAILVVSVYAQSGRFHMPVIPFEMMFAAYGISLCQNKPRLRRWYSYALVAEIGICLFWQWFKLKGQGLI